jgi:hypothetical protein
MERLKLSFGGKVYDKRKSEVESEIGGKVDSIGVSELLIIGGVGAICALPLVAGAIALVVMLVKRGKKSEADSDR